MVAPCKMRSANSKFWRWRFHPHHSALVKVIPSLSILGATAPCSPSSNRAKLAALLVVVQKGKTEIATDSASSLFQIRKQLLNPMAVLHHLHRELLKDIVNLIQESSPYTITVYKVESHSGIMAMKVQIT